MNIKKYSLKAICAALACTTLASSMLAAFATDAIITETPMDDSVETGISDSSWTAEENSFEDIKVTYQQSSSYFVTIPKTIALDKNRRAAYAVKVTGDIDTKQRVYAAPVDGISETENLDFYMKEKDGNKEDVAATITQNKTYWNSEEVANGHEETNNLISAPDLTAGTWEGTFQMEIRLETDNSHTHHFVDGVCTECGEKDPNEGHEHNYVDGKCECGVIDPNHKHNYEDGMCTICGEEESYSVAPAEAYSNWNYTLDDENGVIILNYYKGSETDVIVYGNYVIGDKIYKTQFKSNINGYYESITYPYMFNADSHPNMATEDQKFTNNKNIRSIKFSKEIDTGNVTNMNAMFYKCESLTSIEGLDHFDTSNVTNMKWMFGGCKSLTSLDLSNFDTSQVTDMKQMFSGCYALTNLDVSNFDTRNVTGMSFMFGDCRSLINLNVNNFDTSNVTDISGMFSGCYALTSLDVSNFNTSNVTNMSYMFQYSKTLASLDLGNFDTSNVSTMRNIFYDCTNLETIYVTENKWKTSQANTSSMFSGCGTSSVTFK